MFSPAPSIFAVHYFVAKPSQHGPDALLSTRHKASTHVHVGSDGGLAYAFQFTL